MIPYINVPFDYVASLLGAPTDELKMIFLFLISYPLAGVLKRLPDHKPWTKNVFIISISIFYLVGLFDLWSGLALIIFDAVGAYLIAKYVEGPYMPWIGFSFLMGHMSISHIYRQMADSPSSVDITGAQMVMASELNDDQKERMIVDLPAPLDFAGFVAFFPSIMIGPAFDYIDYHRWLNTSMFDLPPGTDPMKAPPTRKKRKIPRSATPAMWKMASGLLWVLAFLQFSNYFNKEVVLSDRYKNMGLLWRIFHLHMLSFVTRMKYYGAWSLTDGACTLSGIGYKGLDPKTGKPNWDRLVNIRPAGVEFAQNSHAYLGNWNMNTNHWLRNYMYLRVTPKGKKPGFRASMATFVTSAFWHGFYPGYYLTFVLASFIQNVAKNSRRLLRPFFMTPDNKPLPRKRYYDLLTWLVTQLTFSFCTAPFILLTIHDSMLVWSRVYFYCPVGVALCSLFLASPGKAWLARKAGARSARGAQGGKPGLGRTDSMDSLRGTTLGVPSEPGREFDELVEEIMVEVKMRRGSRAGPEGVELMI
ncbi:Lysophospholipid acyltransferase [Friedmanniomyces endolithicus]|uniref:Lysophospholipid acyltransferase n=1 Tax=Friedmanniomyces endolithicus TaxID=329885 RepID=A0AAN6JWN3_9PEZI|nr:Lysophospholipid acyltransferase [Friedmanniomyces endolithicus]KAK0950769.1 Lysophospholipid acyltransferase [Friedmanniomyces endolithicus]KAK0951629.1 Lysophospholipid acyltransferase [Friedmanniomyces endolithicus]KAK1027967.1 Lysophospholipid acyltransferase [Friedmanniomyces endolithicus]